MQCSLLCSCWVVVFVDLRLGGDSNWQPQQLRVEPNGASYGTVAFCYMHAAADLSRH